MELGFASLVVVLVVPLDALCHWEARMRDGNDVLVP
jgi:hypothetical protein